METTIQGLGFRDNGKDDSTMGGVGLNMAHNPCAIPETDFHRARKPVLEYWHTGFELLVLLFAGLGFYPRPLGFFRYIRRSAHESPVHL